MAAIVPGYLWTFRKAGQFSKEAFTASEEEAAEPSSPPVARPSGPPIGPDAAAPSRMGVRWARGDSTPSGVARRTDEIRNRANV